MGSSKSKLTKRVSSLPDNVHVSNQTHIGDIKSNDENEAVVPVRHREAIVFGYIRINYDQLQTFISLFPQDLKLLIMEFLMFKEPPTIYLQGKTAKEILESTDLKHCGTIEYDTDKNHLKIHCYGNAEIMGPFHGIALNDNGFDGHLELIVDGELHITQSSMISLHHAHCYRTMNIKKNKKGGIIDIKCYDLRMNDSAKISAHGGVDGGNININVMNDMICDGNGIQISANGLANDGDLRGDKRNGGDININVGNQWIIKKMKINVGSRSYHGRINIVYKELVLKDLLEIRTGLMPNTVINGKKYQEKGHDFVNVGLKGFTSFLMDVYKT